MQLALIEANLCASVSGAIVNLYTIPMFLRKFISGDDANIMITKALKVRPRLQPMIKRVYKAFKSCQPRHWFDGFMDGIEIELKDLK
jgi:hypothetical protein